MQDKSDRPKDDSGLEFVLDNRRLIVGFALLMVLCGGFFILGFVEGRRQPASPDSAGPPARVASAPPAVQDASGAEGAPSTPSGSTTAGRPAAGPSRGEPSPGEPSPPESRLEPAKTESRSEAGAGAPGGRAEEPAAAQRKPAAPAATAYTVQVGAFRQRKEVEVKAEMLKAKGYECTIVAPQSPDQLFLLQVGRFGTRAEAVRMQLKLRNDGFASFVKSR